MRMVKCNRYAMSRYGVYFETLYSRYLKWGGYRSCWRWVCFNIDESMW